MEVDDITKLCYSCCCESNFSTIQLNKTPKVNGLPTMNNSKLPVNTLFYKTAEVKKHPVSMNYV